MNHNGKWMKPKAIRLSETQRCEIIAKLSKPNALSNWSMRQEYEVSEGTIQKSSLLMMKSSLLRHLLNSKVLLTSMVLKLYTALSSTSTTNYFAMMLKQKLDRCVMKCNDRLRHFCKMLINWHWMASLKNSWIHGKWLCMTCSNNKIWTLTFVKKISALKLGCVLRWEIIIVWMAKVVLFYTDHHIWLNYF